MPTVGGDRDDQGTTSSSPPSGATWLLVTVSTAGGPASLRVQVWRKLRSLGALYLQPSVCLLPARPEVTREVRRLLDRVRSQGGTGRCVGVQVPDPEQDRGLRAELNAARDAEYNEVLQRVPEFLQELEGERIKGRTSYVEVEESEADLHRFQTWLGKIQARDYFDAPQGAKARQAVANCGSALEAFEAEALAVESPPDNGHHATPVRASDPRPPRPAVPLEIR